MAAEQRARDVEAVRAALSISRTTTHERNALADLIAAARDEVRRELKNEAHALDREWSIRVAAVRREGAEQALRDAAQDFENGHVMDEPYSFRAASALRVRANPYRADAIARGDQPEPCTGCDLIAAAREQTLRDAAAEVHRTREHGLRPGDHSAPYAEHFETWLIARADAIAQGDHPQGDPARAGLWCRCGGPHGAEDHGRADTWQHDVERESLAPARGDQPQGEGCTEWSALYGKVLQDEDDRR